MKRYFLDVNGETDGILPCVEVVVARSLLLSFIGFLHGIPGSGSYGFSRNVMSKFKGITKIAEVA